MPKFVLAVNSRGEKQRVPAAWLEDGSPFASDFKLPPSRRGASKSNSGEKSDTTQKES